VKTYLKKTQHKKDWQSGLSSNPQYTKKEKEEQRK
jgi:hypothetical protein